MAEFMEEGIMLEQHSFREVMKQWARMCYSFRCLPNGCTGCPLVDERCYHEMPCRMDISIIENRVMTWAAEHPEPVYPTFAEWLNSIGVTISDQPFLVPNIPVCVFQAGEKMFKPIPADIAQKLGIEPKEDV